MRPSGAATIEAWRNGSIEGEHAYIYLDGIWLKRSWGGEVRNVSGLVAIGVDSEGYRQVLGVAEGGRKDAESWRAFLRHLASLRPSREAHLIEREAALTNVRNLTDSTSVRFQPISPESFGSTTIVS